MPQSLRKWNGASFAIPGPDGSMIDLRVDPDFSVSCNTCGTDGHALHIFRPGGIDYRCDRCVKAYGKAPTVTVNGHTTLATDGRHVGTYKA